MLPVTETAAMKAEVNSARGLHVAAAEKSLLTGLNPVKSSKLLSLSLRCSQSFCFQLLYLRAALAVLWLLD